MKNESSIEDIIIDEVYQLEEGGSGGTGTKNNDG